MPEYQKITRVFHPPGGLSPILDDVVSALRTEGGLTMAKKKTPWSKTIRIEGYRVRLHERSECLLLLPELGR